MTAADRRGLVRLPPPSRPERPVAYRMLRSSFDEVKADRAMEQLDGRGLVEFEVDKEAAAVALEQMYAIASVAVQRLAEAVGETPAQVLDDLWTAPIGPHRWRPESR